MAVTHTTTSRNGLAEYIRGQANAGTTCQLKLFTSGDVELCSIDLADFGAASSGTTTSASNGNSGSAGATGTASYGTIGNDSVSEVFRGACGVGSGEIQINTLSITNGDLVTLTANVTYSAPS